MEYSAGCQSSCTLLVSSYFILLDIEFHRLYCDLMLPMNSVQSLHFSSVLKFFLDRNSFFFYA